MTQTWRTAYVAFTTVTVCWTGLYAAWQWSLFDGSLLVEGATILGIGGLVLGIGVVTQRALGALEARPDDRALYAFVVATTAVAAVPWLAALDHLL